MALHKTVNGKKVFLSEEEELNLLIKWEEEEIKSANEQAQFGYIKDRERAYAPIGDQLDALFKQLNYDRMNGRQLIQEMDDVLGDWLSVKARFPKPGV